MRPFPNFKESQWQVSSDGGSRPLWAPDGGELFYLSSSGQLMAVRVETEPGFTLGNAVLLFERRYFAGDLAAAVGMGTIAVGRTYDISPDGERFLMIKEQASDEPSTAEFILVLNWFEELKRLVPTEN